MGCASSKMGKVSYIFTKGDEAHFLFTKGPFFKEENCHSASKNKKNQPWICEGIMNYRFSTTETNLKALYIFHCFLTTSSVNLFLVTVKILFTNFCLQLCFSENGKRHSRNLSHFENENTSQGGTTFWKWKLIKMWRFPSLVILERVQCTLFAFSSLESLMDWSQF